MATAQRMDHDAYRRKCRGMSDDSLRWVIRDCREALDANPETDKAGYYQDEIAYCEMELAARARKAGR